MKPQTATPTPAPSVWSILRAGAWDLLDAAIAATAGVVAGLIAFAALGPLPLYIRLLAADVHGGITGTATEAPTHGLAESLTGPLSIAILVIAALAALMVVWGVTRAVARALPVRGPLNPPATYTAD
jgi:hypothetical protein